VPHLLRHHRLAIDWFSEVPETARSSQRTVLCGCTGCRPSSAESLSACSIPAYASRPACATTVPPDPGLASLERRRLSYPAVAHRQTGPRRSGKASWLAPCRRNAVTLDVGRIGRRAMHEPDRATHTEAQLLLAGTQREFAFQLLPCRDGFSGRDRPRCAVRGIGLSPVTAPTAPHRTRTHYVITNCHRPVAWRGLNAADHKPCDSTVHGRRPVGLVHQGGDAPMDFQVVMVISW
jgi:hypothetical protein